MGGWEGRQKIIELKRFLRTNMYFGKKIIIREPHAERYIISKVIAEKRKEKEEKRKKGGGWKIKTEKGNKRKRQKKE